VALASVAFGAGAGAGAAAAAAQTPAGPGAPAASSYVVSDGQARLALRDLDGDGRKDLLAVAPEGLSWRRAARGRHLPRRRRRPARLALEDRGWTVVDLDADGRTEVVLLIDGTRIATVGPDEQGALVLSPDVVPDAKGFLPRGIRRVNFVRDVDGDGRLDIVIPGAGSS
jgi:hypothetical protein